MNWNIYMERRATAYVKVLFQHLPGEMEKKHTNLSQAAGLWVEIQT
jgi:hypothetical protein